MHNMKTRPDPILFGDPNTTNRKQLGVWECLEFLWVGECPHCGYKHAFTFDSFLFRGPFSGRMTGCQSICPGCDKIFTGTMVAEKGEFKGMEDVKTEIVKRGTT